MNSSTSFKGILLLVLLFITSVIKAQNTTKKEEETPAESSAVDSSHRVTSHIPFQFKVLSFGETKSKTKTADTIDYAINLFAGSNKNISKAEFTLFYNEDAGNVEWAQFSLMVNHVKKDLNGFQYGGWVNMVKGNMNGVQFGGIGNMVNGKVEGAQVAGIFNLNKGRVKAVQFAGIVNQNQDTLEGLQCTGIVNINLAATNGISFAGLINQQNGTFKGAQVSGLSNITARDMDGVQITGLANVSSGTLHGAQLAGFMNVANKIHGTQIGAFNFSDSITGVPVGFFSYANNGYHKLELSANELFYLNAAFLTGVPAFHNIFTAGIRNDESNNPLWCIGYGFGSSIAISKRSSLTLNISSSQISRGDITPKMNLLNKGYLGLEVCLSKKISLTTGPELNALFQDPRYDEYPDIFTDFSPHIIYHEQTEEGNLDVQLWIGWKFGIRFF